MKKIFVIYPSNNSTNFEISRLNYWINLQSDIVSTYPIPIQINHIYENHNQFVFERIKKNLNLDNLDNIILVFIKSSLIHIDQFQLINSLNKFSSDIRTVLSLGDEYVLSLDEIEVNQFLYDRIIIYNEQIFSKLNNASGKFLFFPILGKEPKKNFMLQKTREEKIIFIGKAYKSRIKIAKSIIKINPNLKFIFAGRGWQSNWENQSNVEIFDWLDDEKYTELLIRAKYSLILDMDEVGKLHVTSKLPDAVSHGCIPIFLDYDSRIKKLNDHLVPVIDTLNNFGEIIFPKEILKEELIIKGIKEKLFNLSKLDKFTESFLRFALGQIKNIKERKLYKDLYETNYFDLMFNKNNNIDFQYKNKKIKYNIRLFRLRIPRKISLFLYPFSFNFKKESSKGYLFIETSGLVLISNIGLIPNLFINFILKRIYNWV